MNYVTDAASSISVERMKALLDSSLDIICAIDKDGCFIDANIATLKIWGYHPDELRGMAYMDLVIDEDKELTREAARLICNGVDMTNFENRYRCKDGTVMPIVWSARWDAAEEIMYCVARNGTEKREADEKVRIAERKLQHSKQLFELFMKNSPIAAWITDSEGVMQYMNPILLSTFGLSEDAIGKSIFELFDTATANESFQNNLDVIYGNKPIEKIERVKVTDGSFHMYKIIRFPIFHGSSMMCGGWAIDISKESELHQQLEENLEWYGLVNEATSDVIYDWQVEQNSLTKGKNFNGIFGYNDTAITMEERYARIHPDDVQRVKASVTRCITSGDCAKWVEQYRYRHFDGHYLTVVDKGFIVRRNNEAVRVIGALQNVTELKKAHDEVVELNKNKDHLLSIIAHDLRSPLSGCLTFIDYIIEEYHSFTKEEAIENLKLVRKNTHNSLELVQELLLWAQNQMQKVACTLQPVQARDEINQVLTVLKKQYEEKNISIKVVATATETIVTDINMFRSIMRNLLSNAIKFSPSGGQVIITAHKEETKMVFSVIDQGVGIQDALIAELQVGKNVKPSYGTKGEKGIGLGLSLTREFIQKCGGSLSIKSEVGKGSTFSFHLPFTTG